MSTTEPTTPIPETMRALLLGRGPDWALDEVAVPAPGAGEVLVRVRGAATNNADVAALAAADPGQGGSGEESVPGYEFAGEVVALGQGVDRWQPGDLVMGSTSGACAEFCTVAEADAIVVPAGIEPERAAALPTGLLTEHGSLRRGGFEAGQSVLITGASTAIGLIGVQIAKALGASRVIGTTRSEDKRDLLLAAGADDVVVGEGSALTDPVLALTDGEGVDLVLDHVAGETFAACLPATRMGGTVVNVGRVAGPASTIDLDALSFRHLRVHGVSFGGNEYDAVSEALAGLAEQVAPAIERGEIAPVIDRTVPLEEHRAVAERLRRHEARGKIVITP